MEKAETSANPKQKHFENMLTYPNSLNILDLDTVVKKLIFVL